MDKIEKQAFQEETVAAPKYSALIGLAFVAFGVFALFGNTILPIFGVVSWGIARFWPLAVVALGLTAVAAPFMTNKKGLAGLFIPGVPVLTTGIILLVASLFNYWSIWSWAWPLEIIALALGFSLAAVGLKVRPLFIPAIIVGINGLIMLFCAVTGWWESWSILWTLEPLAVGLALLFTGLITDNGGMRRAGWILCLIAGVSIALMTTILASISFSLIGAILMITLGGGLLVKGLLENRTNNIGQIKQSEKEKLASETF